MVWSGATSLGSSCGAAANKSLIRQNFLRSSRFGGCAFRFVSLDIAFGED